MVNPKKSYLRSVCVAAAFVAIGILLPLKSLAVGAESEDAGTWQKSGYFEWRNLTAPNKAENIRGLLITNEFNGKLELEYKTDTWRFKSSTLGQLDGSYIKEDLAQGYRYCSGPRTYQNLTICGEHHIFSFPELYVEREIDHFKLRAGNQVIHWGTATFINPTSYFGAQQMRNGFDVNQDSAQGLPIISLERKYEDFKWTVLFAPLHVPGSIPQRGDFWYPEIESSTATPVLEEAETLATTPRNFGKGVRLQRYWDDIDMSISAYNGPDKEAVIQPIKTVAVPSAPIEIQMRPTYQLVSYYGLDFSKPFGDLTLNLEGAFSPNKSVLRPVDGASTSKNSQLPGIIDRAKYVTYSAGLIYLLPLQTILPIHKGKTVLMAEWYDAKYLSRAYNDPTQSNMFTWVLSNVWDDGNISVNIVGVLDTKHSQSQLNQVMASYQTESGWEFSGSVNLIESPQPSGDILTTQRSMFSVFRDKDFARISAKYHF